MLYTPHYAGAFRLRATAPTSAWSAIPGIIKSWIREKNPQGPAVPDGLFMNGGALPSRRYDDIYLLVRRFAGSMTGTAPQYWAIQYEHQCSDFAFRRWRTCVGLSCQKESVVDVSVVTSHGLSPTYVGPEPAQPTPSAPRVIRKLLNSPHWQATDAAQDLSTSEIVIPRNRAYEFCELLESRERALPVVLVTLCRSTQRPMLDASRLAALLAGSGQVFLAESDLIHDEMLDSLPLRYLCHDGAVRVYFPQLDTGLPYDYKRHRFLTANLIQDVGAAAAEDLLVRSILRWTLSASMFRVTTPQDVESREREWRLALAKSQSPDQDDRVYTALLEQENADLRLQYEALKTELHAVRDERDRAEFEKEETEEALRDAARAKDQAYLALDASRDEARALQRAADAAKRLDRLPTNLTEALRLLETLHSDHVIVLEDAIRSAKRAAINGRSADLFEVWHCLHSVATTLWSLYFAESSNNIARDYRSQTGYELALTEGESTNRDKKFATLRTKSYKGQDIDITPHVKFGDRPPKCLRVHYHADPENRVLVIGHCGDHLDTYGTRRQKKR